MGSGSSMKLSETARTNSKSQEFQTLNRNDSQIIVSSKNFKTKKTDRYSYCPSEIQHNFNYQQHLNYYNNFSSVNNYQQQHQYDNKYYANNNICFKFPDVNASNAKNFENFIVPSQLMQHSSKINHITDEYNNNSEQSKIAMTKSLIMYDVDFEKFYRTTEINSHNRQSHNNNSFKNNTRHIHKQPLTTSSSIYQDLIDLDKDLEKRENDLKLQTNKKFSLNSVILVNNINRNSSTSSSSSGCSSDTSNSNNTTRKKSTSKEADTSMHSVNTYISDNNNNKNTNKPISINNKSESPCLLTSVSTTSSSSATSYFNKSILSTSANLSSSCSSISSPTEFYSIKSHEKSKRAENRRTTNGKTKSEYLFNNQKSEKNLTPEKTAGFYKKNFSTISHSLNEQQQQQNGFINNNKENSKKIKAKGRDSGIIIDLFHLNNSMTNIKTKLSNAKHNLRNSLSAFNLKTISVGKKSNKNNKKEENSIKSTSLAAATSYTTASSSSSASSSLSLNKLKPKQNINSDTSDDYEEINSNENNSIHNNNNNNNNISVSGVNDEDLRKKFNSKENISSLENNNNNNKITKSKQNAISSSINNFMLSNLSTTSSSTNSKNVTYDYNNSCNLIKKTDVNSFISNNNLTSNNNKTSEIHPFINCKQTIINNYKEHQLNYECSNNKNNNNNNNNSNIHSLSFSSCNLITSNNSKDENDENKITRFKNSFKSNENKQKPQINNNNNNNSSIKRTMTFHSTNSNMNSVENNLNKSTNLIKNNDIQGSFKTIINCINNNEAKIKSTNAIVSSFDNLPPSSSSNTSNLNSNKLVNSKTISSFKPKTAENTTIPVISIENRSKEMSHSVSMGNQQAVTSSRAVSEKQGLPTHRHQKIVVQASTSDLLNCFSIFISEKCAHLVKETYINPLTFLNNDIGKRVKFEPRDTINWLRSADRALLIQGWQEIAFMNPVNVVFVYLLVRDTLKEIEVKSVYELQCIIMACLYLAFSYMGNEISYPLKPFLIEENREIFWQRIVDLMNRLSACMLRINRDPRFFTELFYELKSYSIIKRNDPNSISVSNTLNININKACYKQLSDQSNNSVEIKIDNLCNNDKIGNKKEDLKRITKNIQEKQISFNSFKPSINIANEQTRVRSGFYISNENQNPLNSFCI
jgi:hypothetical protein